MEFQIGIENQVLTERFFDSVLFLSVGKSNENILKDKIIYREIARLWTKSRIFASVEHLKVMRM